MNFGYNIENIVSNVKQKIEYFLSPTSRHYCPRGAQPVSNKILLLGTQT